MAPASAILALDGVALGAEESWLAEWWPWLALLTLCVLALVALAFFGRLLRLAIRLFLDTKMPLTPDAGNRPISTGQPHHFPSRDGTGLVGDFIDPPAGTPVRGTIVFAHEYGRDRRSALRYTAGLPEVGFRVFAFDFRGHGESSADAGYRPCHWVSDREVNDLLGAVAYVEATADEPDHPVGILGVSRGACAAVLTAQHAPQVRSLVLDGCFSTDMVVETLMKRWASIFASIKLTRADHPPEAFKLLRALTIFYGELRMRCRYPLVRKALPRTSDVPALFVWGELDAYIDPRQRTLLYRNHQGTKHLWQCPEARHNEAVTVAPKEYRKRICEFLDGHMPAAHRAGGGDR